MANNGGVSVISRAANKSGSSAALINAAALTSDRSAAIINGVGRNQMAGRIRQRWAWRRSLNRGTRRTALASRAAARARWHNARSQSGAASTSENVSIRGETRRRTCS